jgi:N-acetylmuramoyl-L-alanine amidase
MSTNNWKYFTVHCSATPECREVSLEDINQMHLNRGFRKVGYHYVILLDGTIALGRSLDEKGAQVRGFNSDNIGICYIGGLDVNMKAKDTRTPEQKESLEELLKLLRKTNRGKFAEIKGHRDFSPDLNNNGIIESNEFLKECPCFDARNEYKHI